MVVRLYTRWLPLDEYHYKCHSFPFIIGLVSRVRRQSSNHRKWVIQQYGGIIATQGHIHRDNFYHRCISCPGRPNRLQVVIGCVLWHRWIHSPLSFRWIATGNIKGNSSGDGQPTLQTPSISSVSPPRGELPSNCSATWSGHP